MDEILKRLVVEYVLVLNLKPNPKNSRTHNPHQLRKIAASIRKFGFLNPILADHFGTILAGHGRFEAAKLNGMTQVPVIRIEHLTPDQIRAYVLADNRLAELAGWDKSILAIELQHLVTFDGDFDVSITGFEIPEVDLIIGEASEGSDKDDAIEQEENLPPVSAAGDVFRLGPHFVTCGNALEPAPYEYVLRGKPVDLVFTDPPYNVKMNGHASGKGRVRHREFPMASGEMKAPAFADFLGRMVERLALAACMLHEPKLLLLDEPTAGVDPKARRDFWDEIHALSAQGLTVLVSTHYMDEAERCDRVVYILNGNIVARGTVSEVVAQTGLITFVVSGDNVRRLAESLRAVPGVEYAAFFGALLHVSGHDRAALESALLPYRGQPGITIEEVSPSLEDVFIHLQEQAT